MIYLVLAKCVVEYSSDGHNWNTFLDYIEDDQKCRGHGVVDYVANFKQFDSWLNMFLIIDTTPFAKLAQELKHIPSSVEL